MELNNPILAGSNQWFICGPLPLLDCCLLVFNRELRAGVQRLLIVFDMGNRSPQAWLMHSNPHRKIRGGGILMWHTLTQRGIYTHHSTCSTQAHVEGHKHYAGALTYCAHTLLISRCRSMWHYLWHGNKEANTCDVTDWRKRRQSVFNSPPTRTKKPTRAMWMDLRCIVSNIFKIWFIYVVISREHVPSLFRSDQ